MSKKRGLGRGLSSLIPQSESEKSAESGLLMIPHGQISPNPQQPRETIDQRTLTELADSIRKLGIIQPLVVNKVGDERYTIIAGERRWRAAALAELREIPVVIKEASPQAMLELALVENIQRDDLNSLEEAQAYSQLINEFGLTQGEVASRVGKSRPTVANMIRLLNLPQNVQGAILTNQISGAHARALLPLPTPEAQTALMNTIITQGLSVRQVENIVKKMLAGQKPKPKPRIERSPELDHLESEFRQSLGTKVDIQKSAKGGKVVIHYYSDEELQVIYDVIVGQ